MINLNNPMVTIPVDHILKIILRGIQLGNPKLQMTVKADKFV